MKKFTVIASLLSLSLPVLGSSLSDSETVEEYQIPVTIGVSGLMAAVECKTSEVILCYPNGEEVTVFSGRNKGTYEDHRFRLSSLSSEDLGKPFYVYYPSSYINDDLENSTRFRTEIIIPSPKDGERIEKIRLFTSTFYSNHLMKWTGRGYAEIVSNSR